MTFLSKQPRLPIHINRKAPSPALFPFTDFFKGFEKVGAVRAVFGEGTESVLQNLKVGFVSNRRMYMGIRDVDGNIAVGTFHLKHSNKTILYLDVVHELFHIKQFIENKKWFRKEHQKFMGNRSLYYVSPIEVPAYKHTVTEAKRIGMPIKEIGEYLKMGPVSSKVFAKFLKAMDLDGGRNSGNQTIPSVRINRKVSLQLFPFTEYFEGFEKVPAVRALFGDRTEKVLGKIKVEFTDFPFRAIIVNEDDGHLVAGVDYFRKGDKYSLYLDVLLCLNILKRATKDKSLLGEIESPVMLESYKAILEESRRIGMSSEKFSERLALLRFMLSPAGYNRFVRKLGLSS